MIVGIDLGTTNSLVAYYTDEGPKVIPNRLGENLTPSVVSIDDDGTVYVGKTAQERLRLYPESSAAVFKRNMGTQKVYKLGKKEFTAEELSSLVIRSLKEDAEVFLGEEVTEAVISVPAYFNDMRRKATKRAGELAGLKVERIINEPTAAAIAHGLYNETKRSKNLVFDLGGGTFDISILDYFDPILEVRGVAGDNYLGGEDFTEKLEEIFLTKNSDIDKETLSEREKALLWKACDEAKKAISDNDNVDIKVVIKEKEYTAEVTFSEYDRALEELYDRIRIPLKKALSDAKIAISDIDKVVLVGGATKYTGIRSFVIKTFHKFPDTSINPDEAVALGAAIEGGMKERVKSIKEVILTDVCPFTLGTEVVVDTELGFKESGVFCPILERNTIIPASRTKTFYTSRDNQDAIDIRVLQGESRIADNNLELGILSLSVPKAKAGVESVEVTYTYDINSILEVEVKVNSTGVKKRQIIKGQYIEMTDEEIDARFKELAYLKVLPRDWEENKLIMLKSERIYAELLGQDREFVGMSIDKFRAALDTQDRDKIEEERKKLENVLSNYE